MQWVDYIIFTDMLDPVSNKYLFEIVTTFQTQWLLKTCKKYRNEKCSFQFGKVL